MDIRSLRVIVVMAQLCGCVESESQASSPGEPVVPKQSASLAMERAANRATVASGAGGTIAESSGWPDAGVHWTAEATAVDVDGPWNVPVAVAAGVQVPGLAVLVRDNAPSCAGCADGSAVNVMLVSYIGTSWTVLATASSDGSGSPQVLSLSTSHVATAGENLRLRLYPWAQMAPPSRPAALDVISWGDAAACHVAASTTCSNMGFGGNAYCETVFGQACSAADEASAIGFCQAHPNLRHDGHCHPQW